jgi:hypothetical protein
MIGDHHGIGPVTALPEQPFSPVRKPAAAFKPSLMRGGFAQRAGRIGDLAASSRIISARGNAVSSAGRGSRRSRRAEPC